MANKTYVGDVGVTFEVSTGMDLTTATVTKLLVKKPNGLAVVWVAAVKAPATGGVLEYTSVSGDLAVAGQYSLQAYVELGGGGKYYGETAKFSVYGEYQ